MKEFSISQSKLKSFTILKGKTTFLPRPRLELNMLELCKEELSLEAEFKEEPHTPQLTKLREDKLDKVLLLEEVELEQQPIIILTQPLLNLLPIRLTRPTLHLKLLKLLILLQIKLLGKVTLQVKLDNLCTRHTMELQ